jgi:hypothetical protein
MRDVLHVHLQSVVEAAKERWQRRLSVPGLLLLHYYTVRVGGLFWSTSRRVRWLLATIPAWLASANGRTVVPFCLASHVHRRTGVTSRPDIKQMRTPVRPWGRESEAFELKL